MTDRTSTTVTTVTIVVSRVLRGRGWPEHQDRASTDLHARAVARAGADGLALDHIGDLVVHAGSDGTWARLTRTGTARRHHEDDGQRRAGGGGGSTTHVPGSSGGPP